MQQEHGVPSEHNHALNGTGENGGATASLTANGMLPTTSAPLKPSIYAPETSSAREEPAEPTSHALASDDAGTASAAEAAAVGDGHLARPVNASSLPASSVNEEPEGPSKAEPVVLPPPHEADAKGLNGSGLASTEQKAEPADVEPAGKAESDALATAAPASSESQTGAAPGTRNPFNESEEASLPAPSLTQSATQSDAVLDTPLDTQPVVSQAVEVPSAPVIDEKERSEAVQAAVESSTESAPVGGAAVALAETPLEDVSPAVPKPEESASAVAKEESAPLGEQAPAPAVEREAAPIALPTAASGPSPRQRTETPAEVQLAGPDATEMTAAQIKYCQNAIKSLKGRPEAPAFLQPVDPIALNIPHYTNIIDHPMDLGTVDIKLALTAAAQKGGNKPTEKTKQATAWKLDPSRDVYRTVDDFEKDVRLIFNNCVTFNGPEHILSKSAAALQAVFEKQLKSMPSSTQAAPPTPVEDLSMEISAGRRASEASASSRPKREIHPPAPKDLPYADRPQAATGTGGKRRKSRASMSSREAAHYDKVNRDQLKYISKVVDDMHKQPLDKFAWVFFEKPSMELDFAESYYKIIKRPISLKEIKERLQMGEYEDADSVKDDLNLMISNCHTFNEPGSDVYKMGQEVKKAWDAKMEKMPRPTLPMDIDYSDDDDEDEDDEDDEENDAKARAIRDQIAALQATLEGLEGSSKAAGAKALASAKASLAAVPAKKQQKRRASESGGASGKKAGASKKAKASSGAAAYRDASETKKPKPAKKSTGGRKRDEEVREVTYEQKEELASKITQLPDERLDGALKIIAEDKPPSANDDEEIELDIDDLSPATLYKLYRYVVRPKGKKETKSKLSASDGRKRGTGGVKRKNLDEEEEAARIARLQQQLQQFESADGASAAPAAPAAKSAGHDDLVASDSSSGEDESDSDSDY